MFDIFNMLKKDEAKAVKQVTRETIIGDILDMDQSTAPPKGGVAFLLFCTSKDRLIMPNAQKSGRGVVFWLTNQKKNGTIGESSVRGRLLIQAPGKLTISAMVPKNQRYGYNPSVGKN